MGRLAKDGKKLGFWSVQLFQTNNRLPKAPEGAEGMWKSSVPATVAGMAEVYVLLSGYVPNPSAGSVSSLPHLLQGEARALSEQSCQPPRVCLSFVIQLLPRLLTQTCSLALSKPLPSGQVHVK